MDGKGRVASGNRAGGAVLAWGRRDADWAQHDRTDANGSRYGKQEPSSVSLTTDGASSSSNLCGRWVLPFPLP